MEKYVKCNLCGAENYSILFRAGEAQANQIVKCNDCSLIYANPRSREEDCFEIENYDPDWILRNLQDSQIRQRIEKEQLQVKDYESTKLFLDARFPNQGNLIEVGSGYGYLLKTFNDGGWRVTGAEPNVALCRYAESENRVRTLSTTLEKADFDSCSMDVVLLMHVIEHVPDPLITLNEIYRILKPNGVLVMETPCYDTWMFKVLGKRERSLSCDGHIFFFTADSLTKLSKKAGLKLLKLDRVGRTLTLDRLLYNVGVIFKNNKIADYLSFASRKMKFNNVSFSINLGDMQRLYLQKSPTSD